MRTVLVAAAGLGAVLMRRRHDRPAEVSWAEPAGSEVDEHLPARVVGDGEIGAVLLHGMFNSGRYWGAAFDALGPARRWSFPI